MQVYPGVSYPGIRWVEFPCCFDSQTCSSHFNRSVISLLTITGCAVAQALC